MNEVVTDWIVTVLLSLLSLLAAYALLYLKKAKAKVSEEIAKIDDEKQQNLLHAAFTQLDELAEKTVGALEQTTAKELRMLVKAGNVDRQQLLNLAPKAFSKVVSQMKPEYLITLEKNMSNVEAYIQDCIENKVFEVKALSFEEEITESESDEESDEDATEESEV